MTNTHLVIPASGKGLRFGENIPKQYTIMANGKTILDNTLTALIDYPFKQIIVVIAKGDEFWQSSKFYQHPQITIVYGGKERFNSVNNALEFLITNNNQNDLVAVHDAVRPLIARDDIDNLLNKIKDHPFGGLLVAKSVNSLKFIQNDEVKNQDREYIYQALTPQIYRLGILKQAIDEAIKNKLDITDEASAIEALGLNSSFVISKKFNPKITTQEDLKIANCLLEK
jgi:2-C-methyl-D-erythritol 4-phosphate cytidylyltransferase